MAYAYRRSAKNFQKNPEIKNAKGPAAYNALLRMLTRRDHSEKELTDKLTRWYTTDAVQFAIAKAHELKLIKDEIFLKKQFADHMHRRSRGVHAINRLMKQKGLSTYVADDEQELAKCQALLLKKFGAPSKLSAPDRVKAYRFLAYRGFDSETIGRAINIYQAGRYDENSR